MPTPPGYRALDATSLPAYIAGLSDLAARLGGGPDEWTISEVGDGNLNLVFLVAGPAGSLCVKQALPYVRLVGEGWPMPLERAFFEHRCMQEHGRYAERLIPAVYHYDPTLFAIVMECLSPHIIMRRGMIQAIRYPRFAEAISDYMARTLFFTSDLAMPASEKRALIAVFSGNTALSKITEDLIFTEPYMVAARNRWTSPQLDAIAKRFREDTGLKLAVSRLKVKFLSHAEALIHGDLHTGSVMLTQDDTRIIDSEFAMMGPMGFDVGAVIGNLLINYFSQDGHASPEDPRADYQAWVLDTAEAVWTQFGAKFLELWRSQAKGDAYPASLFEDATSREALAKEQQSYVARLFADSIGFGSAKMIRRILGLAHNIDLEWIEDPDRRAACEARCLLLARELMVNSQRYTSIERVTAAARAMREQNALAG